MGNAIGRRTVSTVRRAVRILGRNMQLKAITCVKIGIRRTAAVENPVPVTENESERRIMAASAKIVVGKLVSVMRQLMNTATNVNIT